MLVVESEWARGQCTQLRYFRSSRKQKIIYYTFTSFARGEKNGKPGTRNKLRRDIFLEQGGIFQWIFIPFDLDREHAWS